MSDNNNLNSFLNPPSSSGSTNAGAWEAKNGSQLSPQQSYESAASYEQRMSAYNHTKQNS